MPPFGVGLSSTEGEADEMKRGGVNRGVGPQLDGQPAELFLATGYPMIPAMEAFPSRIDDHLEGTDFLEGKGGTELLFMGDLLVINLMD